MTAQNYFVYPRDVDAYGFAWGRLSLTVGPDTNGATRFSGGVVDLPSGEGHSRHNHPGAEEIIFVVSGEGEQMVEDEAGNPIVGEDRPGLHDLRAGKPLPCHAEYRQRPDAIVRGVFSRGPRSRAPRPPGLPHPVRRAEPPKFRSSRRREGGEVIGAANGRRGMLIKPMSTGHERRCGGGSSPWPGEKRDGQHARDDEGQRGP